MKKTILCVAMLLYAICNFAQTPAGFLGPKQAAIMGYLKSTTDGDKHVVIFAHRGAFPRSCGIPYNGKTYYFPENTLGAIQATNKLGIEAIELDIKLSKDKVPMLSHDKTVGRMTNINFNPNITPSEEDPNNKSTAHLTAKAMQQLTCRSVLIKPDNSDFEFNYTKVPGADPSLYQMATLRQAILFIQRENYDMVLALDIKSIEAAKLCLNVVTELGANNWVVFKLNADAIYSAKILNKGKDPLKAFEKAVQIPSSDNNFPKERVLNLIPMFTTNQVNKIPLLQAFDAIRAKPYFATAEVDVKEGKFGDNNSNYLEMNQMASAYGANYKIGTFHTIRDAKGSPDYTGSFFDGQYGTCCYTLPSKLYDYSKVKGDVLPRQDQTDNRWDQTFLQGNLIGKSTGYSQRWLSTDEPLAYIDSLTKWGLRDPKYTLSAPSNNSSIGVQATSSVTLTPADLVVDTTGFYTNEDATFSQDILQYNSISQLASTAKKIATNGNDTYVIGTNNTAYFYNSATNTYTGLGGNLIDIAVDPDGNPYFISIGNKIYSYNNTTSSFVLQNSTALAKKIAAGGQSGDTDTDSDIQLACIGTNNYVYAYSSATASWYQLGTNTNTAQEIAIDANGTVYYVDLTNNIWKWDTVSDAFLQITGKAKKIGAGSDGTLCIIGMDNNLYSYNGYNWINILDSSPTNPIIELDVANSSDMYFLKQDNTIWETSYDPSINTQPAQLGNALNFDGTNDYVNVPANAKLAFGTGDFTTEAWINYTTNVTTNKVILGSYNTGTDYYWLGVTGDNAQFKIGSIGVLGNTIINDGKWHHLVGVRSAGKIYLYVDGILDATSVTNTTNITATAPFTIGNFSASFNFNGKIDEVRIWNAARTQEQIQDAMNTELSGNEANLVSYFNCNQGTPCAANTGITTLPNLANTTNNGTLNNFALAAATSNWVPGVTPSTKDSICIGSTLQLANTTIGGVWSSSNTTIAAVSTTGLVTGKASGTTIISYTFNNTSNSACPSVATTTIKVNALPTVAAITGANKVCIGSTIQLSNTTINGSWFSSADNVLNVNSTGLVTGIAVGTATVTYTATNGSGCSAIASTTITVNALPTATITANGPTKFCQGSSVTLSAATSSSYLWSTGATTQSINVSNAGSYKVTVTNANGCKVTSAATTVTVNALPTATITANGPTTFCQGSSVTLTAATGSSYMWSTGATTQSINVSSSGSYKVTVTNANGCKATSTATTVTVNALPTATITANGPTTFCQGSSVTLTAATGSSYMWSTGATTQSINVSSSGSYKVTVTNANGCKATSAATTVTVNALPIAQFSFTQNTGSTLLLTPVDCNGTSYKWYVQDFSGSIYTIIYNTCTPILINIFETAPDRVTLVVKNANGCGAFSGPILNVPPITGVNILCSGFSSHLSNTIGDGTWSSSNVGVASVSATGFVTANTAGNTTITYTLRDAMGFSTNSTSIVLQVNSTPPVTSIIGSNSACIGSATQFSNAISGGTWYSDNTSIATVNSTGLVTCVASGTATIYYAIGGCGTTVSKSITVNAPTTTFDYDTPYYYDGSGGSRETFTSNVIRNAAYTYYWYLDGRLLQSGVGKYQIDNIFSVYVPGDSYRNRISLIINKNDGSCLISALGNWPTSQQLPWFSCILNPVFCFGSSSVNTNSTLTTIQSERIDDKLIPSNIQIFPNPAQDEVTVQLVKGMENAKVNITSMAGVTVVTDTSIGLKRNISLVGKPSGVYLVNITSQIGEITTLKLIIK